MEVNQNSLNGFADLLPEKARMERTHIIESKCKIRDKSLRDNFAIAIDRWFCQHFGVKDSKNYVYVEGWNKIPENYRGSAFFGAKMYPDAALIMPDGQFKIAIELDHGNKASQVRNALAKASFSVRLGRYNRALLLFFVDPPKSTVSFGKGRAEEEIMELYHKEFQTTFHLI